MSYEPTTWKAGDTVTSAKLNKLEQGVVDAGGVFIVHESSAGVLDKTWKEIVEAQRTGLVILVSESEGQISTNIIVETNINVSDNEYQVGFTIGSEIFWYIASSENGYPAFDLK